MSVLALALLAVAAILFLAEAAAPGIGVAGIAGLVSLVLGVAALAGDAPGPTLSAPVAVPVVAAGVVAVAAAARLVVRSQRRLPVTSGMASLLDHEAIVRLAPDGTPQAFVEGAWWTLRSTGAPLADGDRTWIVDVDGLTLIVEPLPPATPSPTDTERNDR